LRDLPHSRHVLWRDVIKPQNGHILCDRTSLACGVSIVSNFANKSAIKASRLRNGLRSRRPPGSIDSPSHFLPESSENGFTLDLSGKCRMTGPRQTILCRIAHITTKDFAIRQATTIHTTLRPKTRVASPRLTFAYRLHALVRLIERLSHRRLLRVRLIRRFRRRWLLGVRLIWRFPRQRRLLGVGLIRRLRQ